MLAETGQDSEEGVVVDISTVGFVVTSLVAAVIVAVPIWAVIRQRRRQGLDD